jgi:hypothetical protein
MRDVSLGISSNRITTTIIASPFFGINIFTKSQLQIKHQNLPGCRCHEDEKREKLRKEMNNDGNNDDN